MKYTFCFYNSFHFFWNPFFDKRIFWSTFLLYEIVFWNYEINFILLNSNCYFLKQMSFSMNYRWKWCSRNVKYLWDIASFELVSLDQRLTASRTPTKQGKSWFLCDAFAGLTHFRFLKSLVFVIEPSCNIVLKTDFISFFFCYKKNRYYCFTH